MLCAGILPINNMRDHAEAAAAIACRVPQHLVEAVYGLRIKRLVDLLDSPNRPPSSTEVLAAYCEVKGYITNGTGRWDDFRATKELLRDFNDGRLLFATPPDDSGVDLERWSKETESIVQRNEKVRLRLLSTAAEKSIRPATAAPVLAESGADEGNGKREHKRLKNWGKKGKKLRDKDPYGEGNFAIFSIFYTIILTN